MGEHCLFKRAGEVEIGTGLYFENYGEAAEESCGMGTLSFPRIALRSGLAERGMPSNPLDCLRSAFPGSAGAILAQMWNLCEHGRGDDKIDIDAGQKLESFLRHLKESCLTLVGVPFSVLDKKTEKKVLAARREGLLERLEAAQDKEEVLLCTTALIYSQVKTLSIAGVDTVTLVLTRLFDQDKKIPKRVTEALQILNSTEDAKAAAGLIAQAKKFGATKNSKALAALVDDTDQ